MNRTKTLTLLMAWALAGSCLSLQAQSMDATAAVSPTRSQVKMETKEFLRTHRWDEPAEVWVLKSGVEPPTGVLSRAVVRAQRDEFMRLNRWDEPSETWILRKPAATSIDALSREQVRTETAAFMRTHQWNEESGLWTMNKR